MPTFRTNEIPFEQTGQFDRLFLDYIAEKETLRPFYNTQPDVAAIAQSAAQLNFTPAARNLLADVIATQYKRSDIVVPETLLQQLRQENTFTVCTGHQLCLFTGPLYFIYKIATAIRLAEALTKADPSKTFLPVYWMASEDHDFDEIASVHLFGKTVTWNKPGNGAVGRLPLPSLQPVLDEIYTLLGENENAQTVRALLAKCYTPGRNLADATRCFVQALFANHNLLLLDADDAQLKKSFLPFLKAELLTNQNEQEVLKTSAALDALGFRAQVTPRPTNLFYLGTDFRERIERTETGFSIVNTAITKTESELLEELETNPERFSPNVVLRPMYQQTIMPNVAYVGGPGEIAYWLLYKTMFDKQQVFFPALVPRSFFMLLDSPTQERMQKLALTVTDLFTPTDQLINSWVKQHSGDATDLGEQKNKLTELFSTIRDKAAQTDATLVKAVEGELQKQLQAITALEGKLLKAEKQKQETATTQIRKLREKLFPGNGLQERSENVLPLLIRYESFVNAVVEMASPIGSGLGVVAEIK